MYVSAFMCMREYELCVVCAMNLMRVMCGVCDVCVRVCVSVYMFMHKLM